MMLLGIGIEEILEKYSGQKQPEKPAEKIESSDSIFDTFMSESKPSEIKIKQSASEYNKTEGGAFELS